MYQSKQICYIIWVCKEIFLSESCLCDFGIIDKDYPVIGRAHAVATMFNAAATAQEAVADAAQQVAAQVPAINKGDEEVPYEEQYGEQEEI